MIWYYHFSHASQNRCLLAIVLALALAHSFIMFITSKSDGLISWYPGWDITVGLDGNVLEVSLKIFSQLYISIQVSIKYCSRNITFCILFGRPRMMKSIQTTRIAHWLTRKSRLKTWTARPWKSWRNRKHLNESLKWLVTNRENEKEVRKKGNDLIDKLFTK